jgi:hypothetical protein
MTACNSTEDLPLAEYTAQAHAKYTENAKLYVEWIFESEFKEITVRYSPFILFTATNYISVFLIACLCFY